MPGSTDQGLNLDLRAAPPRWLYFVIFAISGFSGLIYESIWSHYLKLFLGHAAYAQSLVLIIFMGGLALGSWLAARYSTRWSTPILAYAIVEAVIGVLALLFHNGFVFVSDGFYFTILPALDSATFGSMLKWGAASALIIPQSILLGMTFPLMTAGVIRRYPSSPGASLAMLYFTNSIGAAVGVLVSGFWLIRIVGLPGTIFTAGLLNIALALAVWALIKLDPDPVTEPIMEKPDRDRSSDEITILFLVAAFITGAASFIYEISWIRMLSLVLGSTTHSFELMLSAFITGLAFGGLWIKRRIDNFENPMRFSGFVQIIMGTLAVLTVPLYMQSFDVMSAVLGGLGRSETGYTLFTVFSHSIALAIMVPTTFLAGMTLPLFTHVLMRRGGGEQAIGRIYAANTLGAIVGVLFAIHIGLPLLGLKALIGFGALLDLALGMVLISRSAPNVAWRLPLGAGLAGAGALVLVMLAVQVDPKVLASGVYRHGAAKLDERYQVLYFQDGKTASISLFERAGQVTISTNGKPDASIQLRPNEPRTSDEITMVMAGALPLAYKPDAVTVGNIGFGSGLTTHTLLADDRLEIVDTVEIEPAMVEAARGFGERVSRAYTDPRSRIHIEDAKTFFSLSDRAYDVIIAEPSNPWVSGVASLFSEEFYRSVRSYLVEDGVLVQWLQLYEFNDELAFSVLKALSQHFSDYVIYNTDNTDILIVAKRDGTLDDPDFDRVLSSPMAADLEPVGLTRAEDFLVRKGTTKAIVETLFAGYPVPANSDYFPYLDLNAGKARFMGEWATLVQTWSMAPLPLLEMLGVASFSLERATVDSSFDRTVMIDLANGVYAALVNDRTANHVIPVNLYATLTAVEMIGRACSVDEYEAEWLHSWQSLAPVTLAYLDPMRAQDLIARGWPENCVGAASRWVQSWGALYAAVAARDANGMASAGSAILAEEEPLDPAQLQYALSAAMLGHVVNGNPKAAAALWLGHGGQVGEHVPPYIDLILHMALQEDAAVKLSALRDQ